MPSDAVRGVVDLPQQGSGRGREHPIVIGIEHGEGDPGQVGQIRRYLGQGRIHPANPSFERRGARGGSAIHFADIAGQCRGWRGRATD